MHIITKNNINKQLVLGIYILSSLSYQTGKKNISDFYLYIYIYMLYVCIYEETSIDYFVRPPSHPLPLDAYHSVKDRKRGL